MDYIGGELELFERALHWKAYIRSSLKPFISGDVLEVGAGIGGTTTALWSGAAKSWTCVEPDTKMCGELKKKMAAQDQYKSVRVLPGTILVTPPQAQFNTILYVDILEHIPQDRAELLLASQRLRPGGKLVVLSPAHMWLYSEFDRSIGHCRRYTASSLLALTPPLLNPIYTRYMDSVGLLASLANRLFLKSALPSKKQIQFWDNCMVPISRLVDPLLLHRLGKSICIVWEKKSRA